MPISDRITDDAAVTDTGLSDDRSAEDVRPFRAQVAERVVSVRERIALALDRSGRGQPVTIVAVTKTHGPEAVEAAWAAGIADVGENKVREAEEKRTRIRAPLRWHLIGHLQRNKAKAASAFDLVHGMDSLRLALALEVAGRDAQRVIDVLVQVNVSGEVSKGGFAPSEIAALCARLHELAHVRVCGVMTMAPFDASETELRRVFAGARHVREALSAAGHPSSVLSMGMSGDFEVAVEEGATHVRLGTILFGDRPQH